MPSIPPMLAVLVVHGVLSALVFSAFSVEVFEFPKLLLLRASCIALVLAGLWEWLLQRPSGADRARPWRDPLALAVLAFVFSAALSAFLGVSPRRSFLGAENRFHGVSTLAGYALLFFAARAVTLAWRADAALLWSAAAGAAGVVAFGALQAAGLDPMAWADVHRFRDQVRPGSTLGNPNFAGAYLAMTLPVCVVLARRAFGAGRTGPCLMLIGLAAASLALIGLTLTRGAWIAAAVALPMLGVFLCLAGDRRGARSVALGCAGAVLLGAAFLVTPAGQRVVGHATERFARLRSPSETPRAEFWRASVAAFLERPWLGAGPDSFQLVYPAHRSPASWGHPPNAAPSHPHNEVLQVAVGQGALGLASLAVLLGLLGRSAFAALRHGATPGSRQLAAGACAVWVAFGVTGQVGFTVFASGGLAAVTAGLLAGAGARGSNTALPRLSPRGIGGLLAVAGSIAAGLLFVNARVGVAVDPAAPWITAATLLAVVVVVAACAWRTELRERDASTVPARAGEPAAPARVGPGGLFVAGGAAAILAALAVGVLVVEPYRADAVARRGTALVASQRPAEAVPFLSEAARRAPSRELFQVELGVAHHQAARVREESVDVRVSHLQAAVRAHERARALEPRNPLNHANRARALADLAHLRAEAVEDAEVAAGFEAALALAPRDPHILADASRWALLAGRPDAAEVLARRSLESYPRHAAAWALVAAAQMQRAEFAAAEASLRNATQADWRGQVPHEAAAWRNLARVLEALGRPAEAREALARETEIRAGAGP